MKKILIQDLINSKLRDVKLNHSPGTYRFYVSHATHFLNWCIEHNIKSTADMNEDVLLDYISDIKMTCSNVTINKRIGMIKRIFLFSNVEFSFLYSLKKLKETRKTFDMLTRSQVNQIVKHVKLLQSSDKLMYKGLIFLLLDTGARINEVISIEKKNINLNENEILLTTTKMKEDRIVFFLDDTKQILKEIIHLNNDTRYLLFNIKKGRQINYDDVRYFMRYLKKELDIDRLHPHMFRHTLATSLIEKEADLISVMHILGHKNIETTERYLHLSKKHVKKTYQDKFKR